MFSLQIRSIMNASMLVLYILLMMLVMMNTTVDTAKRIVKHISAYGIPAAAKIELSESSIIKV